MNLANSIAHPAGFSPPAPLFLPRAAFPTFTASSRYGRPLTIADTGTHIDTILEAVSDGQHSGRHPRSWASEYRNPDGSKVCVVKTLTSMGSGFSGTFRTKVVIVPCLPLPTTTTTDTTTSTTTTPAHLKLDPPSLCRRPFMMPGDDEQGGTLHEMIALVPCPPGIAAGAMLTEPSPTTTSTTTTLAATTPREPPMPTPAAKYQPCKNPVLAALSQACMLAQSLL
jgi:hypothetical protein